MKNFIKWFAGFFEDQKHNASRKAATLYICLGFFYMQVKASIEGRLPDTPINQYILYATVIMILFCVGAITAEYFNKETNTLNLK